MSMDTNYFDRTVYLQTVYLLHEFICFTNKLAGQYLIMTIADLERGTFPNDFEIYLLCVAYVLLPI